MEVSTDSDTESVNTPPLLDERDPRLLRALISVFMANGGDLFGNMSYYKSSITTEQCNDPYRRMDC